MPGWVGTLVDFLSVKATAMADKLSESAWTGFTKDLIKKNPKLDELKPKLDDKALLSALKEFDKTDDAKPEPRLKALDELIKQIPEQIKTWVKRKKEVGDKPFGDAKDKLYELLQEAESLHKRVAAHLADAEAEQAAKDKEKEKAKGKGEDEEEDSPALLTTKMIPLLRELKKGEVVMPFLLALAGKESVVLVSRRAISPARGKLLKEQMAQPSGLKFIRGECQYEKQALTFVVQSPGAALAKRLRQALLDQTGMRWKVRVRGEDGVEEEDGEEEDPARKPATAEQQAYTQRLLKVRDRYQQALREQHPRAAQYKALMDQATAKANEQQDHAGAIQALQALEKAMDEGGDTGAKQTGTPGTPTASETPAEPATGTPATPTAPALAPDALKAQYEQRLATMEPRVLAVLKAQTGDASKIRAVAEFVREKGDSQNYKAALAGMESLEKLLAAAGNVAAPTANPATATADSGAAAFNTRLAALMPQVKEAIAAATDASQDVKLKVSEAGVFARKKDFERANALLDDAEELIEAVLNPDARKTGEAEDGKAEDEDSGGKLSEYEVLRARLESDYEIATRSTDPALADQQGAVRRAWEMATDSFEADDPARALLILKRLADGGALERLLEASRAAASGTVKSGPSLVAQRKFMLEEWSKMPGLLRGKLQALRSTLVSSEADEDPDGLVDGIEDALEEMLDEIKDTMDQAINDGDTAVFKGLRDRARSNGLMQHLMAAPDFDGGALLESVEGTLERIERAMVAA